MKKNIKPGTKEAVTTFAAVIAATAACAFLSNSSAISKPVTGTPPNGRYGWVSSEALISSGGYLYLRDNAQLLPASTDTHTLRVATKSGELVLITNCAFSTGAQADPVPLTATRIAKILCEN